MDNLLSDGVITDSPGFRNVYDDTLLPQIYLEYPVVLRWMHSMQDGDLRLGLLFNKKKKNYAHNRYLSCIVGALTKHF